MPAQFRMDRMDPVARVAKGVARDPSGAVVMLGTGLGILGAANFSDVGGVFLVAAVALGATLVVLGVAVLVWAFGAAYKGTYDPTQVPDGVLPARERFELRPDDSLASGPTLGGAPASVVFDALMTRAQHASDAVPLTVQQDDKCPEPAAQPSEAQLKAYLEAAMGRETLLPAVGAFVPIRVPCLLVRGCTGLLGYGAPRPLLHVEFIVIRDGDAYGVHYEAHVAADPLAVLWFRRLGELPSSDAFSCTPQRRLSP